jgi:hypothetical protein
MPNYPQSLLFTANWPQAWLRELTGIEEQSVAGTDVAAAIALIDRLLVPGHRADAAAHTLVSADRDRLLAAVYQTTYGDRIKSTVECAACEAPYDMDFSLAGLVDHTYASTAISTVAQQPDGSYLLGSGLHLRLPTGTDELAVMGQDEATATAQLLARCLVQGDLKAAESEAQEMLAAIAPMLQTEMAASCPECGHGMSVLFDMQTYLLQSLLQDQERLGWEVHRLATAYKWSLQEILQLPRSTRKRYTALIETELMTSL